ncbi:MAG TPA: hypothetical protein VHZ73_11955 [Vicinamibacterales bacterium]|nr:hypothetical protein [Vicinamibacterales bacterium]
MNEPFDRESIAALRARLAASMAETTAALERAPARRAQERWLRTPFTARVVACAAVVALGAGALARRNTPQDALAAAQASAEQGLPIGMFTPGAVSRATASDLCAERAPARTVMAESVRTAILRDYRAEGLSSDEFELDYLITPELGGVADRRNIWPERYTGEWNARVKDQLEDLLPALVCSGRVALPAAQRDIATDWIAAYRKYFRTDTPILEPQNARGGGDQDDELVFEPDSRVAHARIRFVALLR